MILDSDQINNLIPQSPPFLLLTSVIDRTENSLIATHKFDANQDFFRGHFPNDPIVPGVLLCECCLQAGAVFMALSLDKKISGKAIVTKMDKVKFKNFVKPGDDFLINVSKLESIENYILMKGQITLNNKTVMSMEFTVGLID